MASAKEWKKVMLAQRVDFDISNDHHFIGVLFENGSIYQLYKLTKMRKYTRILPKEITRDSDIVAAC